LPDAREALQPLSKEVGSGGPAEIAQSIQRRADGGSSCAPATRSAAAVLGRCITSTAARDSGIASPDEGEAIRRDRRRQHQMWTRSFIRSTVSVSGSPWRLGRWLCVPAAIGAQLAFRNQSVVASGRRGFQMTNQELATAVQYICR